MNLKESRILKWYFHLFEFIAKNRIKENDTDLRELHADLAMVLSTGIFMWSYAFLAYSTIDNPVPGLVGIICSLTHLLAPLLYRYSNNTCAICNVSLLAGVIHQGTFSYYTGGFISHVLIWYGIIPVLGGLVCGKKGAMTWFIITTLIASVFFGLHFSGYTFPNYISKTGELWTQAMLVFGWIILSTTIVIVYAGLRENTERKLATQGQKIDDLFRVLFHDLANPLGRISIGLSIAKRNLHEQDNNRGIEIIQKATDSMLEITQNVRKMYAVSKGKENMQLTMNPFNSCVEYIQSFFAGEIEKKNIQLQFDFNHHRGLNLLIDPVSFNNQVLANIISNAIKFCPENGKIFIGASLHAPKRIRIDIKDNGIGMSEDLTAQLFDLSKKTHRPGTNGESGTGFGMHITKSFMEMYGGEVSVTSIEKAGSRDSGTTVSLILTGEWK